METGHVKIAMVAPLVTPIREPQLGGSQSLVADIARGLTARGHEVSVFAASGSCINGVRVVDSGIDSETLSSTLFRADETEHITTPAMAAFAEVYQLLAGESFDIIHNHAFDAPAIELAPHDVPVVHTLHLPPRAAIASAIDHARSIGSRVTVATVSEWCANAWRWIVDIDVVLPNGVPVDRIPFSAEGGSALLYAGRLSPEKGAAEAIDIALGAAVPITVVGDPYDAGYTADRIEPYRGRSGVDLQPAVPREELWQLMGRSLAVLCPVQWDEPFGLVAAEAQATGTPVIAFARGALGEVIVDGSTGVLVHDVPAAVDAVRDIARLNRKDCRAHAERSLSIDATLDAHEALYSMIAR